MANTIIVHLPSNSRDYVDNRPNKYRVHLGKTLTFPGEWVCGLHSIIYPYSWPSTIGTLDEQFIGIHYKHEDEKEEMITIPVQKASHTKIEQLRDLLTKTLKTQIEEIDSFGSRKRKRSTLKSPPRAPQENPPSPPSIADALFGEKTDKSKGEKFIDSIAGKKDAPKATPSNAPPLPTAQPINPPSTTLALPEQKATIASQPSTPLAQPANAPPPPPSQKPPPPPSIADTLFGEKKEKSRGEEFKDKLVKAKEGKSSGEIFIEKFKLLPPPLPEIINIGIEPPRLSIKDKIFGKAEGRSAGERFIDRLAGKIFIEDVLKDIKDSAKLENAQKFFKAMGNPQIDIGRIKKMIDSVKFEYNADFDRFKATFKDDSITHLSLSPQLGYVLGFENASFIQNDEVAKYKSDLRGGFSSFAVYAKGLTANMIIGNSLSSLLRVVSISGATPGEHVEKIYDSPLFAPVMPREISEIEIEIRTMDNGRLVPFEYGNVMLVLIFKKVINF